MIGEENTNEILFGRIMTTPGNVEVRNIFICLDIASCFNNTGFSFDSNRAGGDFDSYGQTFPAEELPASNEVFVSGDVPFLFPEKMSGPGDNISLAGQRISTPVGCFAWAHFLGASEGGSFKDQITFDYGPFSVKSEIGFTDYFESESVFGDLGSVICSHYHTAAGNSVGNYDSEIHPVIWQQKLRTNELKPLRSILLGDNPCIHIFSITLEKPR